MRRPSLAASLILGFAGVALADPLDALDPASRAVWARAEEQEAAGRFAAAMPFYRLLLDRDPSFVPARLGLGRALEAQDRLREAEALYTEASGDPDVLEALATLLESSRPADALALWRRLEPVRIGDPTPWLHEARLDVHLADAESARAAWDVYLSLLQGAEPDGATLLGIVDADPAGGEPLLRAYVAGFPEGAASGEARTRLDRMEVEAEAAGLDLGGDVPLPPELLAVAARVEAALAVGDSGLAMALGAELVTRAPESAVAHGRYADALAASAQWTDAEVQARIARRLAPDDAEAHARLGRLLEESYGGRADDEAIAELAAACRLKSGDVTLRLRLGVLQQAGGRFAEAEATFRAVIAADPDGPLAAEASSRLAALTREPPAMPAAAPTARVRMSAAAEHHFRVSQVLLARGRPAEAAVELDAALAEEPKSALLLARHGDLDFERGDLAAALDHWTRSLEIDPAQPTVWRNLARPATDPEQKRRYLSSAAQYGDVDAHFLLARLARQAGDWSSASTELDAYEATASPASDTWQAASALREELEARKRGLWVLGGGAVLLGFGLPAALWWRRRQGRTLPELLAAIPEGWHEAARLLAGVRHEVLKHNTTVLPEVAAALDRGDAAPWENLRARLPELHEKLLAYVGALVSLGQSRGVRFAPERDPTFGPLLRAFSRLSRARRPSAGELREHSRVINEEAYHTLGQLVREICVLRCDETLVREVYARVCAEPGFAGTTLPELWVTGEPLQLRLFRPDLEDILQNLLRNALAAGATSLAVALSDSEDDVTGHPLAELAIIDDAPGTLTNAMIRSRFIGRGLGLAVDLTNRHGGSIRVDARAEGAKAVVVQFQWAEGGTE